MSPRRTFGPNTAMLMLAALGSLATEEEPPPAPESQCLGCVYKRMPADGGHCYMFREEPRGACAQRNVEQAKEEPKPEPVHLCDWSSQPDLHIACGEPWAVPAWKTATTDPHTSTEGVYRTDDGRLYAFERDMATCEACKAAPPYVSPEPEQAGGAS